MIRVVGGNLLLFGRVAALVGAGLLHFTSAVSAQAQPVKIMQTLTETDNERTIDIAAGDTVRITLPENATTGYRWAIDHVDSEVIETVGSEPHYAGDAVGAGGDVTFTFKSRKSGSGEIVLKYWRHFEGDASVRKRFRVRLNARP
jgi:inhibitor of cysteine peptidase